MSNDILYDSMISIYRSVVDIIKNLVLRLSDMFRSLLDSKKFKAYLKHKRRERNRRILHCKCKRIKC